MTTIDYYFSLTSPWSFMGSTRLAKMAAENNATINPVPVKMGAVFQQTGGLPLPQRSPQRQAYRMMEMKRWSKFLGVPLVLEPKHFPYDESANVALVLAAKKTGGDAHKLATEIGRLIWEDDDDPLDPAAQNRAIEKAGLDPDALRDVLTEDEAEAIWEQNTAEAVTKGVFGAPSYVIDGEVFWGQDRLDFVERKLKG